MEAFQPFDDKPMVMQYYEVHVDILENRELLADCEGKLYPHQKIDIPSLKKQRSSKRSQMAE